jgi:sarcosine oxidase subunit alpha
MPARRLTPIDAPVTLTVDGADVIARAGEPIAVALWADKRLVLGRSVKYHRPRGAACFTGRCDGCLMRVDGAPSVRTCRTKAAHGVVVETQNVLGSASIDLLSAADVVFAGGLNHHEMFTWSKPVNRVMQEVARHVAGVGKLPDEIAKPVPVERVSCDVCVIGAGQAGLACARVVHASGARVLVLEEEELVAPSYVRVRTSAVGVFDETDGTRLVLATSDRGAIAITPKVIVIAQGRAESVEAFEGNDLPGVISLAAAERLFACGVLPGEKPVIASESARGEALAHRFEAAGVVPTRVAPSELRRARGRSSIRLVETDRSKLAADVLVVEGRASACYELAAQAGVEVAFDGEVFGLVASDVDGTTRHPRVLVTGSAAGVSDAAAHGERVGAKAIGVARG